nr:hypothetical protein [Tanacetum cinerariifolium]
MSIEEIERAVAQRVANAIEAISIYETKTNLAHKSMSQTEQQEEEVAENASNKRKWESNHNGSLSQQNKGHKAMHCKVRKLQGGHYKSEYPIVKFHEHVDMIHGRMRASKPKTMRDAMDIATKLRNKKISTLVECETENKNRLDNTSKNNQNQRRPNKRQNTGRAYTARHGEKKHYSGSKPLCSKCNYHHDGPYVDAALKDKQMKTDVDEQLKLQVRTPDGQSMASNASLSIFLVGATLDIF